MPESLTVLCRDLKNSFWCLCCGDNGARRERLAPGRDFSTRVPCGRLGEPAHSSLYFQGP